MTKEKRDILHTGTKVMKFVTLLGLATVMITAAFAFFARATTVQILAQRVGLNTSQDIVNNKKANVRWVKQQVSFENRKAAPTAAEKTLIKEAENDLVDQQKLHSQRIKHFEETYKQQY